MVEPAAGVEPTSDAVADRSASRTARACSPATSCRAGIEFTDAMPRDPNGKLYKRKLRDPYWVGRERAI